MDEDHLFDLVHDGMVEAGAEVAFLELVFLDVGEAFGVLAEGFDMEIDLSLAGTHDVLEKDVVAQLRSKLHTLHKFLTALLDLSLKEK